MSDQLSVIYMGTPDFSVAPLEALLRHEQVRVVLVVSQPDKPQGRKQTLVPTPVKQAAERAGVEVFQPSKVKDEAFFNKLASVEADLIITCAYGRILPKEVLALPKKGAYNLHASLLPKYRGASPMQWSLINGDLETGISLIAMTEEMDKGDVFAKASLPIHADLELPSLTRYLSRLAAELIFEQIVPLAAGELEGEVQDESQASYVSLLTREDGNLDFAWGAQTLANRVRGTQPWPSTLCRYKDKSLKIQKARTLSREEEAVLAFSTEGKQPGQLFRSNDKKRLFVLAGDDRLLELLQMQLEGSKSMAVSQIAHNFDVSECLSRV